MPIPYDAVLKFLPEEFRKDWSYFLGVDRSIPVSVIDADVSTVSSSADKVLRVEEPDPWILNLEF
ncbi:MAG: hypothetical protein ACKV0T_03455 [Planctomycetales bacterium]